MQSFLITLAFVVTGAWLWFGPETAPIPIPERTVVTAADVQPTTLRTPITGEPTILLQGSIEKTCMNCHVLWDSRKRQSNVLVQHKDIRLDHGENDNCLNCHEPDQRDKLTLRGGKQIGFADSVQLCAQCHGPTWRDWQRGAHGRTNGYWDKSRGTQIRQMCVACHDPHHPAFPKLDPFPGPNTLRMGTAPEGSEEKYELKGVLGRMRGVIETRREEAEAEYKAELEAAQQELEAEYERLGIDIGEKQ
jgi:hypothetical protein